jgi:hypothetical protein
VSGNMQRLHYVNDHINHDHEVNDHINHDHEFNPKELQWQSGSG